jgi:NADH-quinone oxidoreductase subunit H
MLAVMRGLSVTPQSTNGRRQPRSEVRNARSTVASSASSSWSVSSSSSAAYGSLASTLTLIALQWFLTDTIDAVRLLPTELISHVIIITAVVTLASLITVMERKQLACAQRRVGPSVAGWWGLLQVVADGAKLISKDFGQLSLYLWIGPMLSVSCTLLTILLVWLDRQGLPFSLFILLLASTGGLSHLGVVLTGHLTNQSSKWSTLGCTRGMALYLAYDLATILAWFALIPSSSQCSLTTLTDVQDRSGLTNCIALPGICLLYFVLLLIECGRAPFDLQEAESELVSGFNTEYGGLCYGIYAACEYATLLVGIYVLCLVGLGSPSTLVVMGQVVFALTVVINLRAVLPRLRTSDTVELVWSGLVPVAILHLIAVTCLV